MRRIVLVAIAVLYAASMSRACNIPVFRYALERWKASEYEAAVFHKGDLSAEDRKALDEAAGAKANLAVRLINVNEAMPEDDAAVWKAHGGAATPWAVVRYPDAEAKSPVVWVGRVGDLTGAIDSPVRKEIARRLLAGESAVWIVLEDGNAKANDAIVEKLESLLKEAQRTLKLPEIAADGPQLLSELRLTVAFSMIRLRRDDARERALVEMLKQVEPEYAELKKTVLIPVLGRGRAVSVLPVDRMDERSVGGFAQFMCGACSCEVKEQNPGMDLLMAADWEAIFAPGALERLTKERPAVEGKAVAIPTSPATDEYLAQSHVESMTMTVASTNDQDRARHWLIGGAIVMGISALVSGAVLLRRRA